MIICHSVNLTCKFCLHFGVQGTLIPWVITIPKVIIYSPPEKNRNNQTFSFGIFEVGVCAILSPNKMTI